jgi:serine/threonine protein kinase
MWRKKLIRFPGEYTCPVLIGTGAYAAVYRVYNERLDRMEAVKVFNTRLNKNAINREIGAMNILHIQGVPHVYSTMTYMGRTMIMMEWIRGVSLEYLLRYTIDKKIKISVMKQLFTIVAQLHDALIVHADLKPDNIIINAEGHVYLVDFGFTSEIIRSAFAMVPIRGTPGYMAPELSRFESDIDLKRCDVYSCGIILQKLFGNELSDIVNVATETDPDKRPEDGNALAALFLQIIDGSDKELINDIRLDDQVTSYLISKYIDSVNKLIDKGHNAEAYQLLTEILDESPDNAYAISMLQTHRFSNKKHLQYVIVAAIMICLLVCVYIVAYRFGSNDHISGNTPFFDFTQKNSDEPVLQLNSGEHDTSKELPFRYEQVPALHKGVMTIVTPTVKGILVVDGSMAGMDQMGYGTNRITLTLPQGSHIIEWNDTAHKKVFVRQCSLLPFETKQIGIGHNENR